MTRKGATHKSWGEAWVDVLVLWGAQTLPGSEPPHGVPTSPPTSPDWADVYRILVGGLLCPSLTASELRGEEERTL
ncbi:hypothetical protein AOLI_G00300170 [Acnodon oligacanthus]